MAQRARSEKHFPVSVFQSAKTNAAANRSRARAAKAGRWRLGDATGRVYTIKRHRCRRTREEVHCMWYVGVLRQRPALVADDILERRNVPRNRLLRHGAAGVTAILRIGTDR